MEIMSEKKRSNKSPTEFLNNMIIDASTNTTYQLGKFLGKGGFARVHELTNIQNKMTYAAKIIPKSKMVRKYQIAKVAKEIMLHRGLIHENVVRLETFFEDSLNAYILLENCPNQSLVHLMKKKSCFSIHETRYYVKQLVAGTKYIHSSNIIHRDLKPGNMFLSENMVVKIGDFGLAISVNNMSDQVVLCGTPNYIAPEVLNKSRQSYQIDVWAIGCTLYCLMFGIPPYESTSLELTYERIKSNQWDKSKVLYYPALLDLLERILVLDPNKRLTIDEVEQHIFFDSVADDLSLDQMYLDKTISVNDSESVNPLNNKIFNSNNNVSQESDKMISKRKTSTMKTNSPPKSNPNVSRTQSLKKFVQNIFQKRKSEKSVEKNKIDCCNDGKESLQIENNYCDKNYDNILIQSTQHFSGFCKLNDTSSNYVLLKVVEAICDMKNLKGNDIPKLPDYNLTFVTKWIDYSNKYGFGYQLTNNWTGVLFNDNSTIVIKRGGSFVQYIDNQSKLHIHSLPNIPKALKQKHIYSEYFREYMDEKLSDGAAVPSNPPCTYTNSVIVKRWFRTTEEITMELSDGTVQVNFSADHTKIILSFIRTPDIPSIISNINSLSIEGIVELGNCIAITFINSNREVSHYKASNFLHWRCSDSLLGRLNYLRCALNDLIKVDLNNRD